ncbi:MAG: nitronate monooxygenase, partial [Pseudomonadota bacterium]
VAGLINDIPTCKELIDGIMNEADAILARMNAMSREHVAA